MPKYQIKVTVLIITLLCATMSQAIVIRHDIDDKDYQKLGEKYKSSITYNDGCVGTVIDPIWVLTAAHCVTPQEQRPLFIEHLGNKYPVEFIKIHPKNNSDTNNYDMALLRLKWPMKDSRPALLYPFYDEQGKQVTFVGNGNFGNGIKGITSTKSILRAATNIITGTSKSQLSFIFDKPEEALRLEGISGPHDSGGPAFIEKNDKLYIAGVSSWQDNQGVEGIYGVTEYYARVSTQQQWINHILQEYKATPAIEHSLLLAIKTAPVDTLKKQFSQYPSWKKNTDLIRALLIQLIYQLPPERSKKVVNAVPELTTLTLNNISLPSYVIEQGNWQLFEALIDLGININEKNIYGESFLTQLLLLYPQELPLAPLLDKLLKNGLDINARDERGNTALALATYLANRDNNLERVLLLLEKNANPNIGDLENYTPLMYIASAGNTALAALFLKHGAKIDLKDSTGKNALNYVREHNRKVLIPLLSSN
ncbi:ankyrin repeat domain-containing protein [Thalassotalea piscium]|uniref:Peptidase S1 domain-containing protein n=1 Tax=Thalassotalea piscium TaxID=1230533 RepID=A0A7X0NJV2_9GAMM|nr:ankyrin repeat domain-containing protein [Thalassotalea piscium]MBB6544807.1 hypothetical protein [Thalassotalea piscium]